MCDFILEKAATRILCRLYQWAEKAEADITATKLLYV